MNNPNIYGDPLAPYKNRTGAYIDSDEDNIPDIVESLLSNNSTFVKFAQLFWPEDSEYHDLWDSYYWCIAYFYSIALKGKGGLSDEQISYSTVELHIKTAPFVWIPYYENILRNSKKLHGERDGVVERRIQPDNS